jgi:RNA polymerase sigma-70 factor (ECF subfamily)
LVGVYASPAEPLDFARVYEEHFAFAWRTLRRLGVPSERLDDALQDAFLVISQRLSTYDPARGHLRSWIYGIVVHVVRNDRRRHRRKEAPCVPLSDSDSSPDLGERLATSAPSPSQTAEEHEALRLALSILDALPEERREVLVLADLEEMPIVEIAESLGLNVNTTHSRLRAARREFDEALARFRARSGRRSA